ncbi:MAG: 30S ribosome-binding factor RbfA [Chloroflexota bacterium]|jgi:ribosome-binding factor A|nr:ribosome-binding factor A [Chloroflexota bacterium]MQG20203.1 30S ribosome-binding factor RbfA [SAR202 cluster bacterium]MEC7919337.1 30S ribosome-binding factor RbfA [Chloroflexota bacterium]MEC9098863.1 30S ribosome-binding factor RbfA [Chloroflexota bacterium]MED5237731.1 30S ribosome-binding factor RbfA [Chloroflexota bacterium]|tara:strand:- start:167 stop:511 length:345 start_codon:yes stop_codon:yes gene_type:complete
MVDFRLEKFNNSVKKIVGDYLSKDFYNDGSTIISITDVATSRDFAHAKILVSIFTQDNSIDSIIDDLNQKKSLFQNRLSKSIRTSRIPKIKFEYDNSSEFQKQIDDLINQISTE